MTVPAIGQVIVKSFKYLEPFIELMREGAEVPFTDEQVATRRIYKDGERVKKILSIFDDLVSNGIEVRGDTDILEDLFHQLPPGSKEIKDASKYPWKQIEYQSLVDPKKIEVLSINKIGKQVISGRGGVKSKYEGKESDWTESLQCVALAYKQSESGKITESGFTDFLLKGMNEDNQVNRIVNSNVVTGVDKKLLFKYGLENPEWIKSCVNVANALYQSPYLKSGVSYDFYHAGADEIKWFKSKFKNKFNRTLQNHLRQLGNVGSGVRGYGDSGEDKWNPADIFAVKKQTNEQKVERQITTHGFFAGKISDWDKFVKKGKSYVVASDEKVKEDMAELTRYNNWIHENILSGEFIPISLKKTLNTAKIDLISNPSIQQYEIDVKNIRVSWEPTAQKIYIYFDVIYTFVVGDKKETTKKTQSYFFDCRNFGIASGVQFELGISGSSAKHGKIAAGPAEMIIDLTDPVVGQLIKKTRENYIKFMRTPNVRAKMFPNLNAPIPEAALKSFEDNIIKKSRPKLFTDNIDINAITKVAGWPALLGNYVIYLSKEKNHNLNKSDTDLINYFKSKIAAVELGWIVSSPKIIPVLRNNILKSLYLYASSQGLQIFGDSGLLKTSYFYNSSYVKVRD